MHERDLFIAALEIDDTVARRVYLDSVCAGDAALRSRVERLLSREAAAGDFLEQPAADLCSDLGDAGPTEFSELPPSSQPVPSSESLTMIGKPGDTAKTVLVNPASAATASSRPVTNSSPSGVTESAAALLGTLFGRYRVERVLGSGGMGVVYLAEDLRLGRRVALKIPKFEADADGTFHLIERFRREARTMASVLHRNLCPIFDVDEQNGTHYLTMAFIDGETLAQVIKREQTAGRGSRETSDKAVARSGSRVTSDRTLTSSSTRIAELIRKLALALDAAHRAGVIHRDLKPANVMIDRSGEPILMDFGLAWMAHEADARVTQSGAIVGTPAYMSPEQAEGNQDKVGAASDIYSLGAMLYELLAGQPIHTGGVTRVLFKLMHERAIPPSAVREDVDPNLEAICWKAISRRPEDRFATAAEFAEALTQFLEGRLWENSLTRSVSEGERSTGSVSPGFAKRPPSLTLRVSEPDRTDVLPPDPSAETIAYRTPDKPSSMASRGKSRIVLASLLLIGVLGAVWAIVAHRPNSADNEIVQLPDSRVIPTDDKNTSQTLPKTETPPAHQADFALEFDGKSSHVLIPTLKRDQTEPVTIEAWVEAIEPEKSTMMVTLGGKAYCSLNVGKKNWFANDPTLQGFLESPTTTGLVHLAFVADDQEGRLFLDGKLVDRSPRTKGLEAVEETHAWLGAGLRQGSPNYFFRGRLHELSIAKIARYRQDFTPAQRFVADQHTLALYHFDEGSGNELKDSSGNGHHGQIVGAKWVEVEVSGNPNSPPSTLSPSDFGLTIHDPQWKLIQVVKPEGKVFSTRFDREGRLCFSMPDRLGNKPSTPGIYRIQPDGTQQAIMQNSDWEFTFSPDEQRVFVHRGTLGIIAEVDLKTGQTIREIDMSPSDDGPTSPHFAPSWYRGSLVTTNEYLFADFGGTKRGPPSTGGIWKFGSDLAAPQRVLTMPSGAARVHALAFGRDQLFVARTDGSSGSLATFDGQQLVDLPTETLPSIGSLAFDATDGSLLASEFVGRQVLRVDLSKPDRPASVQPILSGFHKLNFGVMSLTHDGRRLAVVDFESSTIYVLMRSSRRLTSPSRAASLLDSERSSYGTTPLPSVMRAAGLKLGDLDGDGDLDLFVAMLKAPCVMLRNDGKGTFTDSGQQLGDNASFAVALGDLDGDGDRDAFVCNSDDQEDAIWLNDGRGMFQRSPQSFPPSKSNDVALADVDGDKDLDVVVSNWIGDVMVWINDGAGSFTGEQTIPRRENTGVALGDLDNDGDADLVMTGFGGDNRVWLNDGQGQFTDSEQQIELAKSTSVALGDLDRDGDLDLFITAHDGSQVWFNDGRGRLQASEQRLGDGQCEAVDLVDLDADHDLDAVTIGGGFEVAKPRNVWRNDGNGRFQKDVPNFKPGRSQSLAVGDLDGDGDADVVFGNLAEPAEVWLNQSNQSTVP